MYNSMYFQHFTACLFNTSDIYHCSCNSPAKRPIVHLVNLFDYRQVWSHRCNLLIESPSQLHAWMKWSCNSFTRLYMAHRHPIRFVITYHLFVSIGDKTDVQVLGLCFTGWPLMMRLNFWGGFAVKCHTLAVHSPQNNFAHARGYVRTDFSQ